MFQTSGKSELHAPRANVTKPGPKAKMESETLILGHPNFMSM